MVQRAIRTSETSRVETFSDAVFAITLTLLVLNLRTPAPGDFVPQLLHDWPSYVAYLAAFLAIAAIWVTHHTAFTRIERADTGVLLLNLLLLLGASLVPWPTALLAAAIGDGRNEDGAAAVVAYTAVSVLLVVGWILLFHRLARHPEFLVAPIEVAWMRRYRTHATVAGAVAVATGAIGLVAPVLALILFFAAPLAFLLLALGGDRAPDTRPQSAE